METLDRKYSVLIADLLNSKKYNEEDRNRIQQKLEITINYLNGVFGRYLVKNVSFSSGDEVQGLFYDVEGALLYFRLLKILLGPAKIRAGVGYGEWNVHLEGVGTVGQDGEVYHLARKAINDSENKYDNTLLINSNNDFDEVINTVIKRQNNIIDNMSEAQSNIYKCVELYRPLCFAKQLDEYNIEKLINNYISSSKELYGLIEIKQIDAGRYINNDGLLIEIGNVKKITTQIASAYGKSYQSIDKVIKASKMDEERNLMCAILQLASRVYKEEK